MKQETIEEAAERLYSNKLYPIYGSIRRDAFINGAKWQQEKSYSEKEVLHILDTFWDRLDIWYNEGVDENFSLREWFNECELKKK